MARIYTRQYEIPTSNSRMRPRTAHATMNVFEYYSYRVNIGFQTALVASIPTHDEISIMDFKKFWGIKWYVYIYWIDYRFLSYINYQFIWRLPIYMMVRAVYCWYIWQHLPNTRLAFGSGSKLSNHFQARHFFLHEKLQCCICMSGLNLFETAWLWLNKIWNKNGIISILYLKASLGFHMEC